MHGSIRQFVLKHHTPRKLLNPSASQDRILVIFDEHYTDSKAVIYSYIRELLKQIPTVSRLDLAFRGKYHGPKIKSPGVSIKVHRLRGALHPWDNAAGLTARLIPTRVAERHRWLGNFAPIDRKLLRLHFRAEQALAIICFTHSLDFARQIARWAHIFCESSIPHIVFVTPQLRADAKVIADLQWLKATLLNDGEIHARIGDEPPYSDEEPTPGRSRQAVAFAHPEPLSFFDPISYPYRHDISRSRIDWTSWIGRSRPLPARVRDVVLLIRPDWMSCGSGTYFESLSTYFRSKDTLLIDIAIWPFNRPYSRYDRYRKLDEQERSIGAALHFGLRQTTSPLRAIRQLPKLLKILPTTVTTQNLLGYNFVARPKILSDAIRHARINKVYLNHYFTYSFAKDLIGNREFYLDTHDIQSINYLQEGYCNWLTGKMDKFETMFRDELKTLDRAQRLSFVSLAEIEMVKGHLADTKVFNFIAIPHVDALPPKPLSPSRRPRLLIVASGNRANGRNLEWFFDCVWPQVTKIWIEREASRKIRVDVVGGIRSYFEDRDYAGVTFHGIVDRVDEYYKVCDLVALPIITGSGAAMKTIEALLFGRPVVATYHAYRGLPPTIREVTGHAATAEEMAQEIVDLLSLPPKLAERTRITRLGGEILRDQRYFDNLTVALEAVRRPRVG